MADIDGRVAIERDIEARFNRMMNSILSTVQMICKNDYQYANQRKKILRLINDTRRDINLDIDRKYKVEYVGEYTEQFDVD